MLPITINLSKVNRLRLSLRHITRGGQTLFSKISGSGLAFALVATSIIPTNLGLVSLGATDATNLMIPQQTLDETFKPAENEVTVTIGKTQIKTRSEAQLPVEKPRLTQGFSLFHPGVDLADFSGSPIVAIMPGIVEFTQNLKYDYGKAIIVDHGNGITSLYAHLSKISVKVGDKVDSNTEIGEVGQTGHATGPHLHLEVRDHEIPINPTSVIPEIAKLPFGILASTLNQQ